MAEEKPKKKRSYRPRAYVVLQWEEGVIEGGNLLVVHAGLNGSQEAFEWIRQNGKEDILYQVACLIDLPQSVNVHRVEKRELVSPQMPEEEIDASAE